MVGHVLYAGLVLYGCYIVPGPVQIYNMLQVELSALQVCRHGGARSKLIEYD